MQKNFKLETTSASLHLIAMACMLCDHLWVTIVPGNEWLTCIGRIAFPIFAFLIVEGFHHTRNLRNYVLRLLAAAIASEIPFNLMAAGSFLYPFHQNVLWTFLIAIGMMYANEKVRGATAWKRIAVAFATVVIGALAGLLSFADYFHAGVLTVLVFYFFRGRSWLCFFGQAFCLWYLNFESLGGLVYEFSLAGSTFVFPQQGFALLALIPIWLYRGRKGYDSKAFGWFNYLFYPLHMLILSVLAMIF